MPRAPRTESTRHAELAWLRLHNQRLGAARLATPEEVVGWLGAVQSQDYAGAKWSIAQRMRRGSDATIECAIDQARILRTHVLRPTWHFVLPADLRAWLTLSAGRVQGAMASSNRKLGLDVATFARSDAILARVVQSGLHKTRSELAHALTAEGIDASDGVRLAHLLMHAELEAVICSGARRGKQSTYAAFDDRVPKRAKPAREEALGELTQRYFQSHGPALLQDFAWWSGLTLRDARSGVASIASQLEEIVVGEQTFYACGAPRAFAKAPRLHLLPTFDELIVAYNDRRLSFDEPGGTTRNALSAPGLALNGRLIGSWRRVLERDAVDIEVKPARTLSRAERGLVRAASEDYGRFLNMPVRITGVPT